MAFTVKLKRSAEKELENLPARIHDKVINILLSLKENPLPHNSKKLHGTDTRRPSINLWFLLPGPADNTGQKINI